MLRLLLPASLLLTACATSQARQVVGIDQVPPGSTCTQTGALDSFRGQSATTALAAQIMAASRARHLRWVPHGAMVTMEFQATRVTVQLDEQNRVASARCG